MNVDLSGVPVAIGMPTHRGIPRATVMSLCRTVHECASRGIPCDVIMEGNGIVTWARDAVLHTFLKGDCRKLFWIDSDMVWTPEDFLRLLALSTKFDVVGAAYPMRRDGTPVFAVANTGLSHEHGLIGVRGMGLGFTVVDRGVLERLSANGTPARNGLSNTAYPAVFHADVVDGERRGEDFAFFDDVRGLGYEVWMDPGIELGHVGEKEWRGRVADAMNQRSR